MSEPSFQMPHLPSGAALLAVLTFCGTVAASVLAWFGVRFSQRAPLQEAVNHSVETLMKAWEIEGRRSSARISELEHEIELLKDQLGDARRDRLELHGDVANLRQTEQSLLRLLEKAGVSPIPPYSKLLKGSEDEP